MPEIVPGRPEALKGSAAAAVLLMLFDEDEAAQILSRLEPEEVRQLGYAMYDVQDVDPEEVNEALDHFVTKAKKRTTIGYGATRHIRGAMTKALGEERAETILARITPPTRSTQLEMLKWMDAKEIAILIEMEHPQIMAIVLAHLEAPVAADVLQLLPTEYQEEIVYRIATLGPVSNEALDDLERLCGHPALTRLALTERVVPQCQRDPALRRFLLELKRVPSVSVSLPPLQDQAPA